MKHAVVNTKIKSIKRKSFLGFISVPIHRKYMEIQNKTDSINEGIMVWRPTL